MLIYRYTYIFSRNVHARTSFDHLGCKTRIHDFIIIIFFIVVGFVVFQCWETGTRQHFIRIMFLQHLKLLTFSIMFLDFALHIHIFIANCANKSIQVRKIMVLNIVCFLSFRFQINNIMTFEIVYELHSIDVYSGAEIFLLLCWIFAISKCERIQ